MGLGSMLAAILGQHLVPSLIIVYSPPTDYQTMLNIRLVAYAVASLVRTVGWIGVILAIFGWRVAGRGQSLASPRFSVRELLILTLVVALLCGLVRGLVSWAGSPPYLKLYLLLETPTMIYWLWGSWLAISRWKRHYQCSLCFLLGICMNSAAFWLYFGRFSFGGGSSMNPNYWAILGITSSLLVAGGWTLLIAGALGWRERPTLTDSAPVGSRLSAIVDAQGCGGMGSGSGDSQDMASTTGS